MVVAGSLEISVTAKIDRGQLEKEIEKAAKLFEKKLGSISLTPGVKAGEGGKGGNHYNPNYYLNGILKILININKMIGKGGISTGSTTIEDAGEETKNTLKLFKLDLIWRWIKGIWTNSQKYMPLMTAIDKLNTSIIKMFLYPVMLKIFKILLPIYLELIDIAVWWNDGGFENLWKKLFPDKKEKATPEGTIEKGTLATLGLEGITKILEIIGKTIWDILVDSFEKLKNKILGIAEKLGLDEIFIVLKNKFAPLIETLESIITKISEWIDIKLGNIIIKLIDLFGDSKLGSVIVSVMEWLGEKGLNGVLKIVIGTISKVFDPLLWTSFVGDVINLFGQLGSYLSAGNGYLTQFFYGIQLLGDAVSKLWNPIDWLWAAFKDLYNLITKFDTSFSNLRNQIDSVYKSLEKFGSFLTNPIFNAYNKLTGKAEGGSISGGTSYLVGEKGPEIFTPGSSGNITPNNKISGGTTIGNITVNINTQKMDATNIDYIAKQVGDKIYSDIRRRSTY